MPKIVNSSQFTVHRILKTVNREPSTVNRKSAGFTLIELLVVITIIALLIGAGTVSWTNAQKKGRDAKRKSDLKAVQQALELYFQTYGTYPTSNLSTIVAGMRCAGAGMTNTVYIVYWGSVFQCPPTTGPIFMQKLPKGPLSTDMYFYTGGFNALSTNTYTLSAQLENTSDPEISAGCNMGIQNQNYCVTNP